MLATFDMTGVIWFVQMVHYPLFALIPDSHGPAYAIQHQQRTSWVVAPLMLLELATASLALSHRFRPAFVNSRQALAGFALLVILWLSTALIQVRLHKQLADKNNPLAIVRLVRSNWIRTVAWSLRSLLLVACLHETLK